MANSYLASIKQAFDLTGQVALVTGASSGLGEEFSLMLADCGASVIAVARREPAIDHPRIFTASADVTDEEGLARVVDEWAERLGGLNIVVANAGVLRPTPVATVTRSEWQDLYAVNVEGALLTVKAALPHLERGGGGRVVLMSSGSVYSAPPGVSGYVSSKMAIIGMARSLASELAPLNIGVNAITPGFINTPGNDMPARDEVAKEIVAMQILKRPMLAEDLFSSLLYLVSPASEAVTGQTINVDGGLARV